MAQDLDLTGSRSLTFATSGMSPVGEEEINYLWGRRLAQNAVAATPQPLGWATMVLDTTGSAVFGSKAITYPVAAYGAIPWLEMWHARGGTELHLIDQGCFKHKNSGDGERPCGIEIDFGNPATNAGTVWVRYYPDMFRTTTTGFVDFNGNEAAHGTFIYRLS